MKRSVINQDGCSGACWLDIWPAVLTDHKHKGPFFGVFLSLSRSLALPLSLFHLQDILCRLSLAVLVALGHSYAIVLCNTNSLRTDSMLNMCIKSLSCLQFTVCASTGTDIFENGKRFGPIRSLEIMKEEEFTGGNLHFQVPTSNV